MKGWPLKSKGSPILEEGPLLTFWESWRGAAIKLSASNSETVLLRRSSWDDVFLEGKRDIFQKPSLLTRNRMFDLNRLSKIATKRKDRRNDDLFATFQRKGRKIYPLRL